ncbi:MAG: transcription-repair coupling factor [Eubacteriales bacterium]|nr:transcription-repair coupling factor [Eubacteriales bacterium]
MKLLTAPLRESKQYQAIASQLQRAGGAVYVDGCVESQKLHLAYALSVEEGVSSHARSRLFLTYSDQKAKELYEDFLFYDRNTVLFPAKDLIFYQADLRGKEIETERLKCLRRIVEGRPVTVVATMAALMTPQPPLSVIRDNILKIARRDLVNEAELADKLVSMGYEKTFQVERPGQFAIRGDIMDVFDLTEENPYRIELWGDEVESLRSFDILSQRSIEQLSGVSIYPATEMILPQRRLEDGVERIRKEAEQTERTLRREMRTEEAHRLKETVEEILEQALSWKDYSALESFVHYFYPQTENFLDFFDPERTILFLDEPKRGEEHAKAVELEFRESMTQRAEKGYILPGQMAFLRSADALRAQLERYRRAGLSALALSTSLMEGAQTFSIGAAGTSPYNNSFDTLRSDLTKYRMEGYRVLILSASRTRARRLASDLSEAGISSFYSENPDRILQPREVMTHYGRVLHGFAYPALKFMVIAETDIFGSEKKKKKKKKKGKYEGEKIHDFNELKIGDYVVHEEHGVGIYRGIEKIEVEHIAKDYIKIEYGAGGSLYILPTELDVLQKYASSGAAKPKINKLGTQEWANTRSRVQKAVAEVADDLVELYAKRQAQAGHPFTKDTVWQREFEEMFPYEETDDQLQAIEDTKRDMESTRIMDRLICGDVGYGKTEIAVRAAFKAVQDGMQVAVLVPTTILAQQHYNTFSERMHAFPVNVGLLSRFKSAAEQKKTIQDLKAGRCDIVVGTHRLLGKDVSFKSLGLLIVDEEQRFGVAHKEKIKQMKEDVDVLTLTATPIPRTLHMSLVGIRDMSVLEEAPGERQPIQTYVMEYNEEMVREAIVREISRKGQVYYVYNRVNDIAEVCARLQEIVPEARVEFAHGQMSETELEKIMYEFIGGEIDVLVSTTIIETGLDISNANTMIIHDSDRMGLSQLYQLRGRVGRSNRTSFAFLMYKKDKILKEVAEKRLSAIREFTELGSGFKIAMRDLEIRGAGSVLGRAQHGHMNAVGYDLYCKMLDEAVKTAKGLPVMKEQNTSVNLHVDAFIPENYIVNEVQKLDIYKHIAAIESTEDCDEVRDELIDRFGEIPMPARNLLRIALIRAVGRHMDLAEITGAGGTIRFIPDKKARMRAENIPALLQRFQGRLRFTAKGEPAFTYSFKPSGVTEKDEETLLAAAEEVLVAMAETLRE